MRGRETGVNREREEAGAESYRPVATARSWDVSGACSEKVALGRGCRGQEWMRRDRQEAVAGSNPGKAAVEMERRSGFKIRFKGRLG